MTSSSQSKVCFFSDGVRVRLPNRTLLKKFIESLFQEEGKKLSSLNYIFCTDKKLLEINRDYLRHDFYTDIITFDLSDSANVTQGEVYISYHRVRDNAKQLSVPFSNELQRVIFHGALHLCGYGDKNKKEIASMRALEDYYLEKFRKFHVKHSPK